MCVVIFPRQNQPIEGTTVSIQPRQLDAMTTARFTTVPNRRIIALLAEEIRRLAGAEDGDAKSVAANIELDAEKLAVLLGS